MILHQVVKLDRPQPRSCEPSELGGASSDVMSDTPKQEYDRPPGEGTVLDQDVVRSLKELGGADHPGLVMALIEVFLEDASEQTQLISAAWDCDDLEAVSAAAHALKSASAGIGALRFADICKDVEQSARSGGCAELSHQVGRCRQMYAEVQTALDSMSHPG